MHVSYSFLDYAATINKPRIYIIAFIVGRLIFYNVLFIFVCTPLIDFGIISLLGCNGYPNVDTYICVCMQLFLPISNLEQCHCR